MANKKLNITSTGQLAINESELFPLFLKYIVLNRKTIYKVLQGAFDDVELLTSEQVRKELKISKTTLYRYVKNNALTPVDELSKKHKFIKSEVMKFKTKKERGRNV
jgi:predicted DNA-binding transcriptional regulator AlpA